MYINNVYSKIESPGKRRMFLVPRREKGKKGESSYFYGIAERGNLVTHSPCATRRVTAQAHTN